MTSESLKMLQKWFEDSLYYEQKYLNDTKHSVNVMCHEVIKNLPHARRPSTSVNDYNIQKFKETALESSRVFIKNIAEDVGISYACCQTHIH